MNAYLKHYNNPGCLIYQLLHEAIVYTLLRYYFLYIFVFSTIQAADRKEIPQWQIAVQQKLQIPCEQIHVTDGTPIMIASHPATGELAVLSYKEVFQSWPNAVTDSYHCLQTYKGGKRIKEKYIDGELDIAAITIIPDGTPCTLERLGNRVRLSTLTEPVRSVGIRVRQKDHLLGAVAATPTGHIIALQSRNKQSGQNFIGLCDTANRTINTIQVDVPPREFITHVALSDDGLSLAWSTNQNSLYVRHSGITAEESEVKQLRFIAGYNTTWKNPAWSPDKTKLATGVAWKPAGSLYKRYAFALICAASGKVLYRRMTDHPVTACAFIDDTRLAIGINSQLLVYALHLNMAIEPSIFSPLGPIEKALCTKTAACIEPYRLKNKQERDAYTKLPPALQKPWLFTGTQDPSSGEPTSSSKDADSILGRITEWADSLF